MTERSTNPSPTAAPSTTPKISPSGFTPSRGPDGYYRLTPTNPPPPSHSDITRAPNTSTSTNTSHPAPGISDERSAPRSVATESTVASESARQGGERGSTGATLDNPVIREPAASSSNPIRPSNGDSTHTGEGTTGIRLRVGSAQIGGGREHSSGGGKGEASGPKIPQSNSSNPSPTRSKQTIRLGPSQDPLPATAPSQSHGNMLSAGPDAPRQPALQLDEVSLFHAAPAFNMDTTASTNGPSGGSNPRQSGSQPREPSNPSHSNGVTSGPSRPPAPSPMSAPTVRRPPPPRNAEAGPSKVSAIPESMQTVIDFEGDSIMRGAAEGLVQEQRRSLRGRAARSGVTGEEGGSEMSVIAGVSASGKGVRIGGSVKIGTGPGGVQRKKKKGEMDSPNQDFCSTCRGVGRFLCCDGCPRSFHFMCLEPPLRIDELPEEEVWYCKKCRDDFKTETAPIPRQESSAPSPSSAMGGGNPQPPQPPPLILRPIPKMFRMLVKQVDMENPTQFRLSTDIKNYFAGVTENAATGGYVEEIAKNKRSEKRTIADPIDPIRTKDTKTPHNTCYACGGTTAPIKSLLTDPEPAMRPTVACDYCALHWHMDCLNPPLVAVPSIHRKWMCPNHVDQLTSRRRTIREGMEIVNVKRLGVPNNGNVEVVPDRHYPDWDVDDMMLNKRKYRVPDYIIQLDFFDRIKGRVRPQPPPSEKKRRRSSDSSLTSLSDVIPANRSDLEAAELIMSLSESVPSQHQASAAPAVNDANSARPPAGQSRSQAKMPMSMPTSTTNHGTHLTHAAAQAPPLPRSNLPRVTLTGSGISSPSRSQRVDKGKGREVPPPEGTGIGNGHGNGLKRNPHPATRPISVRSDSDDDSDSETHHAAKRRPSNPAPRAPPPSIPSGGPRPPTNAPPLTFVRDDERRGSYEKPYQSRKPLPTPHGHPPPSSTQAIHHPSIVFQRTGLSSGPPVDHHARIAGPVMPSVLAPPIHSSTNMELLQTRSGSHGPRSSSHDRARISVEEARALANHHRSHQQHQQQQRQPYPPPREYQ